MKTQNKIAKPNLVAQIESVKYYIIHAEITNSIEVDCVKLVIVVLWRA